MIPRTSLVRSLTWLAIAALAFPNSAIAQGAAAKGAVTKRPLTHADYDTWRSIQNQRLSKDGKFLVYTLVPQDADGELVVRNLTTGKEWRAGTGWRPPTPPPTEEELGGAPPPVTDVPPAITVDDRFVVFQIRPTKAAADSARKAKKRPDDQPKNALGIMDVATGAVVRVERLKSFQVPEDAPGFVAYLLEAKPEGRRDSTGTAGAAGRRSARNEYGTDLVLRNLADNSERSFPDVFEFTIGRDAKSLVYAVASRTDGNNGVYAVIPGNAAEPVTLLNGKGKYRKLAWDDKQTELAFLADRGDSAMTRTSYHLYRWDRTSQQAEELVAPSTAGFWKGMVISERGAIDFSKDGDEVFFGVAPPPPPEKDTTADPSSDEKVSVDLWNWRDDYIQPMQKVRANQDRNRSYRAVFHLGNHTLVQLADSSLQTVTISDNGRVVVGQDDRPYRKLVGIESSNSSDLYVVNPANGQRTQMLLKQRGNVTLSPSGKYALYFRDNDWFVAAPAEGKTTNLTKALGVPFYQEDFDSPMEPPAWGSAGFTRDEKYVLLYDHYDIWQVPTDGSGPKNLTDGVGRSDRTIFRYVRLEQPRPGEDRGIDATKPLLLSAESEWSRQGGFYRDRIDGAMPEKLVWSPRVYGNVLKARDADVVIYSQQSFSEFPDLLVTTPDFKLPKKVTDANAQRAGIAWGTSELIRFKNADGVALSATLYKPENFDRTKKYPMIVYIYEKLSQNVNRFVDPRPTNSINTSFYVSNGYLVLQPDIVYTVGYPGPSAMKCVMPAVQAVVDLGFVDEANIGIQGHSWGGYQIAYMVTQTNRFKAAAPGAVVVNMTSAYSGIRWGSGLPRQFQYEHTQSRIGGSIWEYPLRFMQNSALFQLDRVQTPILSIHNDADDAVPWYQGIEFYLGLRRLGKEVYLFSYNGEPHNLRRRANQKDYTRRLQEYFDHFLKGAPEPDWMQKGIPFLDKDKVNATVNDEEPRN